MDLLSYLRVLRRRWRLLMVCALVGGAIGAGSAVASSSDGKQKSAADYYRATHTLIASPPSSGNLTVPPLFSSLDQMALLVTTSDVEKAVAADLGADQRTVAERISTLTDRSTNTLQISAVDADSAQATRMADAVATELVDYIKGRDQENFNRERDDAVRQLNDAQQRLGDIGLPVDAKSDPVRAAEQESIQSQYRLAYERVQLLATQGGPAPSPLSTLDTAQAVPIDAGEYDAQVARDRAGQNHTSLSGTSGQDDSATASSGSVTLPGPVGRGVLGTVLGLMLGIAIAVVTDRFDQRLRTRDDAEAAWMLPVLAEIPNLSRSQQHHTEVLAHDAPLSRTAEAYRAVRSSLLFHLAQPIAGADGAPDNGNGTRPPQRQRGLVVMVASASPGEGKTTTTANLAAVFAEAGSRVLVVNGDFRRPKIHEYFGVPDEPRRLMSTPIPGVLVVSTVLADPGANPAQIAEAQRQIIAEARRRVDVVLLDTPPLLTTNDAIEMVGAVDQVLIVARADITTGDRAQRAAGLLQRVNAPAVGVVFVGVQSAANDYYYYYSRRAAKTIARSQRGGDHSEVARRYDPPSRPAPDAPAVSWSGPRRSS